ncbi:flagellar hook-length control protein FliK [Pseudomonas saliphila]|uniref:flagellar hook-length control protein FliK n=1 Tax=Pseudomonas saliphila TaxID=2586906 RepID=UPI00123C12AB|nr:flagellar hook-length control protein FliK [Pseudomonas saliphila]
MSVSQALLALSPSEVRPAGNIRGAMSSTAGDTEEVDFANLLAEQQPERLDALLKSLEQSGMTAIEDLALAGDGKPLPDAVQDWLGQLADLGDARDALSGMPQDQLPAATTAAKPDESLTELSERWMKWLNEARGSLTPSEPKQPLDSKAALASLGTKLETPVTAQLESLRQPIDAAVPVQRTVAVAQSGDMQAAFAGKLAGQLDAKALGNEPLLTDSESEDGLSRPAMSTQPATAQAALTARPVNAAAQALGVPFGQQSWGEAAVEKVMWMSSQNLRSVEIKLDPAELGPLEIHIQNRGQEHQVQFVSQNPSVREALEAQMFRLREMFSQQGMDQVNVTVSDGSAGQQSGREAHAGASGEGRQQGQGGQGETSGQSESLLTTAEAARVSAERLVDYYA